MIILQFYHILTPLRRRARNRLIQMKWKSHPPAQLPSSAPPAPPAELQKSKINENRWCFDEIRWESVRIHRDPVNIDQNTLISSVSDIKIIKFVTYFDVFLTKNQTEKFQSFEVVKMGRDLLRLRRFIDHSKLFREICRFRS